MFKSKHDQLKATLLPYLHPEKADEAVREVLLTMRDFSAAMAEAGEKAWAERPTEAWTIYLAMLTAALRPEREPKPAPMPNYDYDPPPT